ncbi:MAG: DUF5666 domain-containing protein [Burkholderiales bacterium]|nr:DUF5666 domain-containing protein [Burkholderiales bacterium]
MEGYVSDFTAHPGTFKVGNVEVQTMSTTKLEGMGTLADNIKIEVEGTMSDGVLVAHEVSFE